MTQVILFRGKAGTGKTTISNAVGAQLHIPVIHKDDLYDSIAEHITNHVIRNKICFDILFRLLESSLSCNATVIIDFGYNHLDDVLNLKSWIEQREGILISILCTCSDETVWAHRLKERKTNPQPNQLITDLHELKKHYSTINAELLEDELQLDCIEDIHLLTEKAIHYISEKKGK
ncbi:AAA domain-containing protein [Bacillus sp. 491mf]|uniref:AAA family ATPase n=1 Tax=Bacillus TaxID=1386 RepID=UPI00054D805A|nr:MULTISPECIES: AAA family ATPase [unclassified Bacillus (in: firmicutes)]SFD11035.1 AAA domain-containing protein [Bacillus sp. 491mf]